MYSSFSDDNDSNHIEKPTLIEISVLAVIGNSRSIKEKLKKKGAIFHPNFLYKGSKMAAWVISSNEKQSVEDMLNGNDSDDNGDDESASLECLDYSDRSVAVFGDSRPVKEDFKEIGGRFNRYLKRNKSTEPGWVFLKEKKDEVIEIIEEYNNSIK